MASLIFYFDPLCPWAWRTSVWIRAAQRELPELAVEWRLFSLIENSKEPLQPGPPADIALRTLIQARRHGGNEAVGRLYEALGTMRHERHQNFKHAAAMEAALQEAGLPAALYGQAQGDPSTAEAVLAEHREAAERYAAFGVPWLVAEGQEFGFYGPIIKTAPEGKDAVALWEHTSWLLAQPYLYELKRER